MDERIRQATFEHDPVVTQLRAGGQHGCVHGRAAAQPRELHQIGLARAHGRQDERDGRAALGHAGQLGDRGRVGPRGDDREHVCPVGLVERPLPGIDTARAHFQRQHDRRHRSACDRDRERARKQPRAHARERQPDQQHRHSALLQLEQRSDLARRDELRLVGNQSVAERDHPIRRRGDARVMGDEHQRLRAIPSIPKEAEHLAGRRRVEIPGRLVRENDVRPVGQGARQRDPLLLPAGQLRRSGSVLLGNAEIAQQLVRRPTSLPAPPADQQQGELDVLDRRKGRHEIEELEHEADLAATENRQLRLAQAVDTVTVEPDLPCRRSIEPGQQVEQGGLPAPARAHDRDELAALDRDVDATKTQHLRAAGLVRLRELPRLQDR